MDIEAKTAVIIGAGQGVGRRMAIKLAERGANVGLFDTDAAGLAATADACRWAGVEVAVALGSNADSDHCAFGLADFERRLGPTDILVDCAAIPGNTSRSFQLTWHSALAAMKARGAGVIINISARGTPLVPFADSKIAVPMTSAMLQDCDSAGIRVCNIGSGATDIASRQGAGTLNADDVVDTAIWLIECPSHIRIDEILVSSTATTAAKFNSAPRRPALF